MSIEKLSDESQSTREQAPFAQILNEVIEHIKDNDAFRIYSFLCSKDRNWKVIKEWTAKVCGVGEKKAKKCWSYLARCGLIQYVETRDKKGKIIKHDIHVLVGYQFNKNEPFLNKKEDFKSTGVKTAPMEKLSTDHRGKKHPGSKAPRVDIAPLLNKDITNKDFERNNDKSFCEKDFENQKPDQKPISNREENEKRHDWAAMKSEAAHIRQNEEFKKLRMVIPPEFTDLMHQMQRKSNILRR